MRKAFTIVALIAAMFVAGNVQAQSTIYAGYAPESFISGNTSSNYQGFFAGFTKNFGLTKGIGIAAGAEFRMNTKSGDAFFGFGTGKSTQALIDVPILFNYGIGINHDITITPFVGPMVSLALAGNTKTTIGNNTTTYNWYGDNSKLNRFNLYAVFGADVKFIPQTLRLHMGHEVADLGFAGGGERLQQDDLEYLVVHSVLLS